MAVCSGCMFRKRPGHGAVVIATRNICRLGIGKTATNSKNQAASHVTQVATEASGQWMLPQQRHALGLRQLATFRVLQCSVFVALPDGDWSAPDF